MVVWVGGCVGVTQTLEKTHSLNPHTRPPTHLPTHPHTQLYTLQRFLNLVAFLDRAKKADLLPTEPCLFAIKQEASAHVGGKAFKSRCE